MLDPSNPSMNHEIPLPPSLPFPPTPRTSLPAQADSGDRTRDSGGGEGGSSSDGGDSDGGGGMVRGDEGDAGGLMEVARRLCGAG